MVARETEKNFPGKLFEDVKQLFNDPKIENGEAKGSYVLTGAYESFNVELKVITDTLATRKLPSLWLLTTIKSPKPVHETFDMMLRPAAATSFSNFDFLPNTIPTPKEFPFATVIRSSSEKPPFNFDLLLPKIDFFEHREAKELLITPNGIRIVIQLAEAQRAYYAVYREARFYDAVVPIKTLTKVLDTLLAIRKELVEHKKHV